MLSMRMHTLRAQTLGRASALAAAATARPAAPLRPAAPPPPQRVVSSSPARGDLGTLLRGGLGGAAGRRRGASWLAVSAAPLAHWTFERLSP